MLQAFNRRAMEERSLLHMCVRTGHLESCVISTDPCVCAHLLEDPGRIFDTPSAAAPRVPLKEAPKYFMHLGFCRKQRLVMRDDGHLYNCVNGIHFKQDDDTLVECPCPRIIAYPERFIRIPENEWCCRVPDDKEALKREWMRLNDEREKKFNMLCQCLGKTYRFIDTPKLEYHLNTCTFSRGNEGPDNCGCHLPIMNPARFFVEKSRKQGHFVVRGEEGDHREDCSRVKTLVSKNLYGNEFPENLDCDCQ